METGTPDLAVAREFAEAIKAEYPDQLLAYNCSPSFNWQTHLDDATIAKFQRELGAMGYKFQFITLAGFHSLNQSMFDLARGYAAEGMPAYVGLQDAEFAAEATATPPPGISGRSAPATSTWSARRSRRTPRRGAERLDRERAVRPGALTRTARRTDRRALADPVR